ncbi:MAG TPA: enoyl-CoA hydratase family protein [Planctomycetota bacterium]|nr:enoyl-CoA hydratase family protein [Planctomycetota bacterium]
MSAPSPADGEFRVERADGLAVVTLTRPSKLNALTLPLYRALTDWFFAEQDRAETRAVVITGEGRGFCSGGDVNEIIGALLGKPMRDVLAFTRLTGELIGAMRRFDRPIVAALNGVTAGAGAVIALASDFRVMSDAATIAFLFTRVGLTGADMGAGYLLPRVVGFGRATEMLMLGDAVPADEALRTGLVHRVVPPAEVASTATALARRLADGPTLALRMTKKMLENEWSMSLGPALEAEAQAQALLMMGEDHAEFHRSFREKRPPAFKGR